MESKAVASFWKNFDSLPKEIQRTAVKQFKLWRNNASHPSVQFKKVNRFWSARVTDDYRALGVMDEDTVIWFWIGNHADYDRLLKRR